ncbi:hypothetical protein AB0L44_46830 [Nonomuraea wenchangensis]|uniref:hypothetical protein n=1 Tax=Nonomuraea wenchangensis TaxID=568860 RepID=UPI00342C47C0
MNPNDRTSENPQQPHPPTPNDPVSDYLDFLDEISRDVDQIPEQKIDERARQLFGESALPDEISVPSSRQEDVIAPGQLQQGNPDCILKWAARTDAAVQTAMPQAWTDILEIVTAAHREAHRIRCTAREKALAEAAQIRAAAEHRANEHVDAALTQAADIVAEARHTAKTEAERLRSEAEREASTRIDAAHGQAQQIVAEARRTAENEAARVPERTAWQEHLTLVRSLHLKAPESHFRILKKYWTEVLMQVHEREMDELREGMVLALKASFVTHGIAVFHHHRLDGQGADVLPYPVHDLDRIEMEGCSVPKNIVTAAGPATEQPYRTVAGSETALLQALAQMWEEAGDQEGAERLNRAAAAGTRALPNAEPRDMDGRWSDLMHSAGCRATGWRAAGWRAAGWWTQGEIAGGSSET